MIPRRMWAASARCACMSQTSRARWVSRRLVRAGGLQVATPPAVSPGCPGASRACNLVGRSLDSPPSGSPPSERPLNHLFFLPAAGAAFWSDLLGFLEIDKGDDCVVLSSGKMSILMCHFDFKVSFKDTKLTKYKVIQNTKIIEMLVCAGRQAQTQGKGARCC